MKNVINGIVMAMIAFLVMAAVMIVSGRSVRKNELEKALEQATEQAVEQLSQKDNQKISREEFLEIFKENLSMGIESDSEVIVSIMAAEPEKGILSVQAEEKYQNPLGKEEKMKAQRTIILESYSEEKKNVFSITYKVGDRNYKVYTVVAGTALPVPINPEGNFICWLDENGQSVNGENIIVDSDRTFTAKMN